MRISYLAGALALATLPGLAGGTPYHSNGPTVSVSYVALKATGQPKWAFFDPLLPGPVVTQQTQPFKWDFFPAAAGTLQLRVTSSIATGKKTWWLGITPDAAAQNAPGKVLIDGFPDVHLNVQRVWAGESAPANTSFRTEQNQQTKHYKLIFTFDTPLPKGKTTWVTVTTGSTKMEPGAIATFADNFGKDSPWPQIGFMRPLPAVQGPIKPGKVILN